MRKKSKEEQNVQISIVKWLTLRGFFFSSSDNGVNVQNPVTRFILQKMGRRAGMPDLTVYIENGTIGIEVKRPVEKGLSFKTGKVVQYVPAGKQSNAQKEVEARLKSIKGHDYIVAYSLDDVIKYFTDNGIKAV